MKKVYLIVLIMLTAISTQAQNLKINLANGETVTYTAEQISSIEFNAEPEEVLFHEFTGWLDVSSAYFQDTYYGDTAVVQVYTKGDAYICRFHDAVWGDGRFEITLSRGQISGTGTMAMDNHRGGVSEYEASISGPMTKIAISMPDVMGGTTITWTYGEAPLAKKISGTYSGTVDVCVGETFNYSAEKTKQIITANSNGTINLTIEEYQLTGTQMGDLTLGKYTIENIPYSEDKGGFYKEYADDELAMHFKAVNDKGNTTMDNDYTFNNETITTAILVEQTEDGVKTTNDMSLGAMPFSITATMEGAKANSTR